MPNIEYKISNKNTNPFFVRDLEKHVEILDTIIANETEVFSQICNISARDDNGNRLDSDSTEPISMIRIDTPKRCPASIDKMMDLISDILLWDEKINVSQIIREP